MYIKYYWTFIGKVRRRLILLKPEGHKPFFFSVSIRFLKSRTSYKRKIRCGITITSGRNNEWDKITETKRCWKYWNIFWPNNNKAQIYIKWNLCNFLNNSEVNIFHDKPLRFKSLYFQKEKRNTLKFLQVTNNFVSFFMILLSS